MIINLGRKWNYFKNKKNEQEKQLSNTFNNKQKFDSQKHCQCKILLLDHTHISIIVLVINNFFFIFKYKLYKKKFYFYF